MPLYVMHKIVTQEVFPLMNAPSNAKILLIVELSSLRVARARVRASWAVTRRIRIWLGPLDSANQRDRGVFLTVLSMGRLGLIKTALAVTSSWSLMV